MDVLCNENTFPTCFNQLCLKLRCMKTVLFILNRTVFKYKIIHIFYIKFKNTFFIMNFERENLIFRVFEF